MVNTQRHLMANNTNKVFVFSSAVRGFHVYRDIWNPTENEELECLYERNNMFDPFAIKTCRQLDGILVGHLPREISRPTKFLLDRGATIQATLSATHYRRSPLFQGGLEIPCNITVSMPGSIKGHMILQRYQNMVEELYCQPKDEIIMGSFLEKQHGKQPVKHVRPKKRKTVKKVEKPKGCKDIRNFFQQKRIRNDKNNSSDADITVTVTID